MMPKGYKTDIKITDGKIGPEKRQELLDGIADQGTFLPRGVHGEDMDESVIDFFKNDKRVTLTIDGKKIPVIFLTIQRWIEFTKNWEFTDSYKNIEMPFITIVRKPDIQQGQNQAGLWNIPGNRTYTYMKVPTWDGIRKGMDLYKIPQPTSVDLSYEVRLFTNKMKDLNRFNEKMQLSFQSKQCYSNVNGHPMPLHLESIGDESNIDDFENRRFYVQMFELKLLGYIVNEEEFEVIPTLNRTMVAMEIDENKLGNDVIFDEVKKNTVAQYTFVFKPKSDSQFTFNALYQVSFTELTEIKNISRIIIYINGVSIFDGDVLTSPILFEPNDVIKIKIYKNLMATGSFKLIGTTIN